MVKHARITKVQHIDPYIHKYQVQLHTLPAASAVLVIHNSGEEKQTSSNGFCRRRFSAAVKATCLTLGPGLAKGLIQPVFAASAALPDADESAHHTPEHVLKVRL
jgi:hypothetical protein